MYFLVTSGQATLKSINDYLTQQYQDHGVVVAFGLSPNGVADDNWFAFDGEIKNPAGIVEIVLKGTNAPAGLSKVGVGVLVIGPATKLVEFYRN